MGLILSFVYLSVFVLLIRRWHFFRCEGIDWRGLSGILLLKFGFGLLLYFIYAYIYAEERHSTDAFRYFDDAAVMYSALWQNPSAFFQLLTGWYTDPESLKPYTDAMAFWDRPYSYGTFNDNRTMIRLNALVHLFSFGYYHVHTVFWCFFSFAGLVGIYKAFSLYLGAWKRVLIPVIFLLPSTLFWGSAVLKEGLVLGALGLLVYHLVGPPTKRNQVGKWMVVMGSLTMLLLVKTYILMALAPAAISYIIVARKKNWNPVAVYATVHGILLAAAFNLHHFVANYNIVRYIAIKQRDFLAVAAKHEPGSLFDIGRLEQTAASILMHIPEGIFNSLLRPLPWNCNGAFMLLAAFENIAIVLVLVLILFKMKKWSSVAKGHALFCLSFALTLMALIGMITPISGALVRYKVPAIPLLLIGMLLLFNFEKAPRILQPFKLRSS